MLMKAKHLILSFVASATLHASEPMQANAVTDQLRQGLLEEEVNKNPAAAAGHYLSVLDSHKSQRAMAATAQFRLGELARKSKDTAAAVAAYQAVLQQFPEQEELVRLSRANLTALGVQAPATTGASPRILALEKAVKKQEELIGEIPLRRAERLATGARLFSEAPAHIRDNIKDINDTEAIQAMHRKLSSQYRTANEALRKFDLLIKGDVQLSPDDIYAWAKDAGIASPELKSLHEEHQSQELFLKNLRAQGLDLKSPQMIEQNAKEDDIRRRLQDGFRAALPAKRARMSAENIDLRNLLDKAEAIWQLNSDSNYLSYQLEIEGRKLDEMRKELAALRKQEANWSAIDPNEEAELGRLRQALTKGPDHLRVPDEGGLQPLHRAAIEGWTHVIDFLLENGCDVNATTVNEKATALHIAAGRAHLDVVEKLIAAKADPNLTFVAEWPAIGDLLLSPLDNRNLGDLSALDLAMVYGNRAVFRFLLKSEPKLAAFRFDAHGAAAYRGIWLAIATHRNDMALELMRSGTPLDEAVLLNNGVPEMSLVRFAEKWDNRTMVEELIKAGASTP